MYEKYVISIWLVHIVRFSIYHIDYVMGQIRIGPSVQPYQMLADQHQQIKGNSLGNVGRPTFTRLQSNLINYYASIPL